MTLERRRPARPVDRPFPLVIVGAVAITLALVADGCTAESEPGRSARSVEAVVDGRELRLRTDEGDSEVVHTLDPRGESTYVSASVRPGSDPRNATIIALTRAEGMYDLRWIEIVSGEPGELRTFDVPYRPASDMTPIDGAEPTVAWTPDGGSIGWIEWSADGATTLRTVGWSEGPGTGDTATDNASFGVAPIPPGSRIVAWTRTGESTSRIDVRGPRGGMWTIAVERQADGALALPPDAVREGPASAG